MEVHTNNRNSYRQDPAGALTEIGELDAEAAGV
jgi:hypothetical protein